MPKLTKNRLPAYRQHKARGLAVVTLSGKDFYLGPYGSKVSREEYDRLIAGWLANGRQLHDARGEPSSINELLVRYYRYCESHYANRRNLSSLLSRIRCALRPVNELFGTSSAETFGPRALMLVREQHIRNGLARKTVNDNVQAIRRMFRWAVREEIVPPSVHHGLSSIEGLRHGESKARDPRKVDPAPDEDVDTVLPHVLRPVRAMIRLQQLTGMRSGEVTIMRTGDLEMTGPLWTYRPRYHKSDHRGLPKEICLGPRAQQIIQPFLRTNLDEHIFRPDEAEAQRDVQRRCQRKTPLSPSSVERQKRRRKQTPKRAPSDHYSVDTYAQAIRRGCTRAGVPHWTPRQLRHNCATRVRRDYGIEAARVMLGHRHVGVTEIYAERDLTLAATIAMKHG